MRSVHISQIACHPNGERKKTEHKSKKIQRTLAQGLRVQGILGKEEVVAQKVSSVKDQGEARYEDDAQSVYQNQED